MQNVHDADSTELSQANIQDDIDTSTNRIDYLVTGTKVVVGLVPYLGPILAELVGTLVPNQRIDRIEAYLRVLNARVEVMDQARVVQRSHDPAFVSLFEDGAYQAARALSEERIDYIASVVAHGLSDQEVDYIRSKHLLSLLDAINDAQVIMLNSYGLYGQAQQEFYKTHDTVLRTPVAYMGASQETLDQHAVHESFKDELVRLGLLRLKFRKPKKGELPEFDEKTGMVKAQGREITSLGRLLLRHIDFTNTDGS